MKYREAKKILLRNGFVLELRVSFRGKHVKFFRNGKHLVIPHGDVNKMVWRRLCKEHGIDIQK